MNLFPSKSLSDNRKSAIQNPKWLRLSVIALVLGVVGTVAQAQQPSKIHRIGFLSGGFPGPSHWTAIFRRELSQLGYVGKNIVIESRYSENKLARLPNLADELVRLNVDVIVAGGVNDTRAAKNATKLIPIVGLNLQDPVALGLVDTLARPGGNLTGFATITEVLAGKRLELLKETVANLSRVALLWNPQFPDSERTWKESRLAARELGLQLHSMEVSSPDGFETAFKSAIKARSGALATIPTNVFVATHRKRIADLAAKYRLPAVYDREDFVASGGLMSYGADDSERLKRVAVLVDKILKGVKPADLPVEQPTKLELVINLRTAKQIGLVIPPNVLARADRVIR
jgi:putative ABC transport system substrate-binding protein